MSILEQILETKRGEVAARKGERPLASVIAAAETGPPVRAFAAALRRAEGQPMRVIAEVKRASPSAGPIRPDADPAVMATEYQEHGAAALSILTDKQYFDGDLSFLDRARQAVDLPLLRKDFLIDPYQVAESRAAGADAVLLIVAALSDELLAQLFAESRRFGMDALVEVHSEAEAERAVQVGARLIGVNHRNLKTFEIDLDLSGRLRRSVPSECVLVAESGIKGPADVRRVKGAGADAILVGEGLMRAESPGQALRELVEAA